MIHNRLKFTLLLLAPRGWGVRGLDWCLSQPGFDPCYRKLICLATLMSSDRTKQICLWMTTEISIHYIYIYIYVCVCVCVCVCVSVFVCVWVCMCVCVCVFSVMLSVLFCFCSINHLVYLRLFIIYFFI